MSATKEPQIGWPHWLVMVWTVICSQGAYWFGVWIGRSLND